MPLFYFLIHTFYDSFISIWVFYFCIKKSLGCKSLFIPLEFLVLSRFYFKAGFNPITLKQKQNTKYFRQASNRFTIFVLYESCLNVICVTLMLGKRFIFQRNCQYLLHWHECVYQTYEYSLYLHIKIYSKKQGFLLLATFEAYW